jgi:hypothetical protein
MSTVYWVQKLLQHSPYAIAPILPSLSRFGCTALQLAVRNNIVVTVLQAHERYSDLSPQLQRMRIEVDAWPAPPAGLFVVEERTIYLRSLTPMTVAHEFAHALDCALGEGSYLSESCPHIRMAFDTAQRWVTPYASTSIDEYFAESVRAYVGLNDDRCRWPKATPERLQAADPRMSAYIGTLFSVGFAKALKRAMQREHHKTDDD